MPINVIKIVKPRKKVNKEHGIRANTVYEIVPVTVKYCSCIRRQ